MLRNDGYLLLLYRSAEKTSILLRGLTAITVFFPIPGGVLSPSIFISMNKLIPSLPISDFSQATDLYAK
ncbi:MAG: hypothetical protein ACI965_002337 [Paraglaciecola sp.]|jgi:hypothetical protein